VKETRKRTGAESFVAAFSYAGGPYADAEASMRPFAREVRPELAKVAPTVRVTPRRDDPGRGHQPASAR